MSAAFSRAALLGLVSLFLLPLVFAWLMYTGVIDWRPEHTRNRGQLVQPPLPAALSGEFELGDLKGHWMLVYPLSWDCGERCREELIGFRQIKRALGRNGDRVRTVLLADEAAQAAAMQAINEIDREFAMLTDHALQAQLREIGAGHGTYVIDPLGNIMMYYRPGSDPKDMKQDLERLLTYGKTDPQ